MTKITTDFAGTETTAVVKTRLQAILEYYLGTGALSAVTSGGDTRTLINSVDPDTVTIADGERASVFRPKLNTLNTPGEINNFGAYRTPDGEMPSLVLDFVFGAYGADDMASFDKYTVGDDEPSLVLDFTEAQYGRSA